MVFLEPKFQDKKFLCPCVNVVISRFRAPQSLDVQSFLYLDLHITKL